MRTSGSKDSCPVGGAFENLILHGFGLKINKKKKKNEKKNDMYMPRQGIWNAVKSTMTDILLLLSTPINAVVSWTGPDQDLQEQTITSSKTSNGIYPYRMRVILWNS